MVKKHVVVPVRTEMQAMHIMEGNLSLMHSNVWQYEGQDFVCDIGVPRRGGTIVWVDSRPTYFDETQYAKKFTTFVPVTVGI